MTCMSVFPTPKSICRNLIPIVTVCGGRTLGDNQVMRVALLWKGLVAPLKETRTSLVVQWMRILQPVQGTRFNPWSGKIPHAAEHLSLLAATPGPVNPKACAPQPEKPPQWEALAPQHSNTDAAWPKPMQWKWPGGCHPLSARKATRSRLSAAWKRTLAEPGHAAPFIWDFQSPGLCKVNFCYP